MRGGGHSGPGRPIYDYKLFLLKRFKNRTKGSKPRKFDDKDIYGGYRLIRN